MSRPVQVKYIQTHESCNCRGTVWGEQQQVPVTTLRKLKAKRHVEKDGSVWWALHLHSDCEKNCPVDEFENYD
jgi:hypothetical protein